MSSKADGHVDRVEDISSTHGPSQQPKKRSDSINRYQGTGMTPSIITTINNTSPTPPVNNSITVNNNHINNHTRVARRIAEPYESYIEDSFVGYWEHEDDLDEYQEDLDEETHADNALEKSELQHPSTLEFDFDSFGPESMIYTQPVSSQPKNNQGTANIASARPPTLVEVSPEAEKADENPDVAGGKPISSSGSIHPNVVDAKTVVAHSAEPHVDLIENLRSLHTYSPSDYLVDPSKIDLKVIEPYKKVISHAGYCHHFDPNTQSTTSTDPAPAVIVFSACYLPDRSRSDYDYVMDHLFLYVLMSLHELIADDYILIYLHNTQAPSQPFTKRQSTNPSIAKVISVERNVSNNLPTFTWMKRCYQMIDRKLRKNLKILYLVKPTFWLKTIVIMCKPFISTKFSKKLKFVENMDELRKCIPVDKLILPASASNI